MVRFLILLVIAFFCGSIGARIAGSGRKGCVTSIILGFIGALIGGWLSRQLDIPDFFYLRGIPVLWSIAGSSIFVAIINALSGGAKK